MMMMMMMMELEKEEKLEVKATVAATAAASKYKFFERHSVSLSLERPYDNIKINNFLCYLKSVCDLKPSICKIKTLVKNKGKKKSFNLDDCIDFPRIRDADKFCHISF